MIEIHKRSLAFGWFDDASEQRCWSNSTQDATVDILREPDHPLPNYYPIDMDLLLPSEYSLAEASRLLTAFIDRELSNKRPNQQASHFSEPLLFSPLHQSKSTQSLIAPPQLLLQPRIMVTPIVLPSSPQSPVSPQPPRSPFVFRINATPKPATPPLDGKYLDGGVLINLTTRLSSPTRVVSKEQTEQQFQNHHDHHQRATPVNGRRSFKFSGTKSSVFHPYYSRPTQC